MTIMKHTTTCWRREMRALYEARQVNVAPEHTRLTIVKGLTVRPQRNVRDHGTAEWNAKIPANMHAMLRAARRAALRFKENNNDRNWRRFLLVGGGR